MARPLADYVQLPKLDEYKEWFKAFADLKREDGILQVTWKTNDGPMHHSGMSHRAMSQLTRVISMDLENEIIIYTHIGDNWMIESDANGWETYSELPRQRFEHQYFDDTNLIKNMVFDLQVPTIGAMPGPGFHWDSAMLCDVTLARIFSGGGPDDAVLLKIKDRRILLRCAGNDPQGVTGMAQKLEHGNDPVELFVADLIFFSPFNHGHGRCLIGLFGIALRGLGGARKNPFRFLVRPYGRNACQTQLFKLSYIVFIRKKRYDRIRRNLANVL